MEHKIVPIEKIKPDPEQPRKNFDEDALEAMAISIKNEGIINSIEVDEHLIIITGEQRWRAAKKAGLKEVPIKIIAKLPSRERFIRQVQENIHQNTMSPLDTAEALDKIRKWILTSAAEVKGKGGFRHGNRGSRELHKLLGKSEASISDYLDLLGETGEMKKALRTKGFQMSKIAEIKRVPPKYSEELRHMVATKKDMSRDVIRAMVGALKRADKYGEDKKAKELFKQDFQNISVIEAINRINKIIPDETSRVKEPSDALKFLGERIISVMELLDEHPLNGFDNLHRPLVVRDINALGFYLKSYLQGKSKEELKGKVKENHKLLLGK